MVLCGGGGDDQDVNFDFGEALAWTNGLVVQMQGYSHAGIVVSMGTPRWVFAFISRESHVA